MHDYMALTVVPDPCSEDITDLLAAFLGDEGYESFTPSPTGLTAYIKASDFNPEAVEAVLADFPIEAHFDWNSELVKGRDWNSEWEKNYFRPIVVGSRCVVHSSFHKDVPPADYDIVIDPKMAFGTGHHSTTSQMMSYLLDLDLGGKTVIDMGAGTGILSILAAMRGAGEVTGIEIDPFACDNAVENVRLNNVEAKMLCGDSSALSGLAPADVFMANINRNVITSDIAAYAAALKEGGTMLLSGFYDEDIPVVRDAAQPFGLQLREGREDNKWVALRMVKNINN